MSKRFYSKNQDCIQRIARRNVIPLPTALPIHIQRNYYQQLVAFEDLIKQFCADHADYAFAAKNSPAALKIPSSFDHQPSQRLIARRLQRCKRAIPLALVYAKRQSLNISIGADCEKPGTIRMFGSEIVDNKHFSKDTQKILCYLITQADMYTFSTMEYEGSSVVLLEFIYNLYQNDTF